MSSPSTVFRLHRGLRLYAIHGVFTINLTARAKGRISGTAFDPTQPPSQRAWRTAWRKLTEAAGLQGLRLHDLRHHAITKLAESNAVSEATIMAIAGHVRREMLQHYSHIRQEARRIAVAALDNVTILAQLERWQSPAAPLGKQQLHGKKEEDMVGAEGFEPPTLCSQNRSKGL